MNCRLCGFTELELGPTTDSYGTPVSWVSCPACGFRSHTPYKTDAEQAAVYGSPSDWLSAHGDWDHLVRNVQHNANLMDADRDVYPLRRHLEVACGLGYLAWEMKKRGWNSRGQELRPGDVDFAREKGLDVSCCSIFDFAPGQEFDVISTREFVEHVWDFSGLFRKAFTMLAKGGALWIQTPVIDRLPRFEPLPVYNHEHVSLFTLDGLLRELRASGFEIARAEIADVHCGIVKAVKRTCPV
jgi:2-polyprenyl-3-methyl-5-hydroxy-6-metoxy-1,4-benzoquinol methylase